MIFYFLFYLKWVQPVNTVLWRLWYHLEIPAINCGLHFNFLYWLNYWLIYWQIRHCYSLDMFVFCLPLQNVVMLMSDIVDWLIPDIPKDISLQIHKEKILLVDLFMKEEQGKESKISSKVKENCSRSNNNNNNSTTAQARTGPHTNNLCSEKLWIAV